MPHGGEGKGLPIHRISGEMKGDSPQRVIQDVAPEKWGANKRGRRIGESAPDGKACPVGRAFVKSYGHGERQGIEELDIFRNARR